jgi:hypothetical protein
VPRSVNSTASTTTTFQSISVIYPSLEAPDLHLHFYSNNFQQPCLPRSLPPLLPRRPLRPPHLRMAHTSVRLSQHNAVATQSRKLHRVRRSILTHSNRYGKGCYHQGESMFSGASLPPHLCLRRLPANWSAKHMKASQRSRIWRMYSLTRFMHATA